jgi:rubrerythrin
LKRGLVLEILSYHCLSIYNPFILKEIYMAKSVKGTKTEQSLKEAFAGESQANRRYLYFANQADIAGANDVAAVFRSTAEGETGHAHGHMEYLINGGAGEPGTGMPAKTVAEALQAAIAGETHEYTDMYPGMAKTAREEGFDEIADWFETLAKAERSHANKFTKTLEAHLANS